MISVQQALDEFPRALSSYPDRGGHSIAAILSERLADRAFQRHCHRRSSCWPSSTRSRRPALRRWSHSIQRRHDERARAEGRRQHAERRCRAPALSRRSRSRLRPVGARAPRGDGRLCRMGAGQALLQRRRQLHRTALRRRDHGARRDAADHRIRRRRAAACGRCRSRHACGMVGHDSRSSVQSSGRSSPSRRR